MRLRIDNEIKYYTCVFFLTCGEVFLSIGYKLAFRLGWLVHMHISVLASMDKQTPSQLEFSSPVYIAHL